jgi:hypothetical protein
MTSAFIVNLDVGSDTDFITLSQEIHEALDKTGMEVVSVQPWKRNLEVTPPDLPASSTGQQ